MSSSSSAPSICAHIPCNAFGPGYERLLLSLKWVDNVVLHDASDSGVLADQSRRLRDGIIIVKDSDPDIRMRLLRHKDITRDDYILWAQADEVWPNSVGDAIRRCLNTNPRVGGLRLQHKSFSFGELHGTGWPQVRVVMRKELNFKTKDIHEMPSCESAVVDVEELYEHYPNPNLLLLWIKNYKYNVTEILSNPHKDEDFDWLFHERISWMALIKFWLRINKHFWKVVIRSKSLNRAAVFWASSALVMQMMRSCAKAEAYAHLQRHEDFDMRGHTAMPQVRERAG